MTDNESPDPEVDDLGLTLEDWLDLRLAYNFGLMEPTPGTAGAEVLRRMDEYARREAERVADEREAEERAWRASRRGYALQAGPDPEAGQ
jgi:hypothetical protein